VVNLEFYKVFYYVAKHKSITRAATELYISQPAVSQAIKQLENSLGGRLFLRTPKGVTLTPEGELLFVYVSKGYEYLVQAENKYKELLTLETGEIRIGASDMTLQYYLLTHLEQFHSIYPKVKVRVSNAPTPETLECLNAGKIDFAVVSDPVLHIDGLKIIPVCKIQDIFIANEKFSELKHKKIGLVELEKYPIICLEERTSTRKYVDGFFKTNGSKLNPEFELATSELIVQFAKRNLGIGCIVKNFAEKYLNNGNLFEINLKTPIPERNICVVYSEKMPISPAGKKLLNTLVS